jgi:hypothetical protein
MIPTRPRLWMWEGIMPISTGQQVDGWMGVGREGGGIPCIDRVQ